jgi:hypothetical protein
MMHRTLSFLFAAAFGATLGALTALELSPLLGITAGLAATLGVIVGGLTGYVAVDFRQFCTDVVHAAHTAYVVPNGVFREWWNIPLEFKLNGMLVSAAFFMIPSYFLVSDYIIDVESGILGIVIDWTSFISGTFFIAVMAPLFGMMVAFFEDEAPNGITSLYWVSPIGIAHFVLLMAVPWLIIGLCKIGHWIFSQTIVFVKTSFIAVHSERRMLCCLDAMLGTLVGYYFGSWPVGTVAGLAFALVSYELVSKRWLKLQTV